MAYDFSRFSTQSFERFAQGLAVAQFGAGTQIYGAGADGGREATFEGQFADVGGQATHDGYVVVQAKYRKIPRSPQEDLSWLIAQSDAELKKFTNPKRKLRRPDYYVLVSNLTLTPGAANAGQIPLTNHPGWPRRSTPHQQSRRRYPRGRASGF